MLEYLCGLYAFFDVDSALVIMLKFVAYYVMIVVAIRLAIEKPRGLRRLLVAVAFPLIPLVLLFWVLEHHFFAEWRLKSEMRKQGRLLSKRVHGDQSGLHGGTIFVDTVAPNFVRTRLWWTPDDVLSLTPIQPIPNRLNDREFYMLGESESYEWPPFDRWAWGRYLEPSTGKGYLIEVLGKWLSVEEIALRYPGCAVVRTFSGGRYLAQIFGNEDRDAAAKMSDQSNSQDVQREDST